jgi:hypothetical protein
MFVMDESEFGFGSGGGGASSGSSYPIAVPIFPAVNCRVGWNIGTHSLLGHRKTNEDRFVAVPDLSEEIRLPTGQYNYSSRPSPADVGGSRKLSYCAVYDGHCGAQAAEYLKSELHGRILR